MVIIAHMEDYGFYIMNTNGDIVSALVFDDYDAAENYCDYNRWDIVNYN
jgi:hypothetical protein